MPRSNAPWFRASKNTWCVWHDGRQVSLGVRGKNNRKAALLAFAELLTGRSPRSPADPPPAGVADRSAERPATPPRGLTCGEMVERFLATAGQRLKPRTLARYQYDADKFVKLHGATPVDRLTGDDLLRWLGGLTTESETTRSITFRSVSAIFGWAAKAKLIRENPARGVPIPKTRARGGEAVISDADHSKLLDAAATPGFRRVLRVLHATGCRPGEVAKITAENFDPANRVAVLADHKTDRTGRPRLIFFPPDVAAELAALAARYGSGPLLRTRRGRPWTADAVAQAMRATRERAGVKGTFAYGFRHSFATDALANGVPEAQVAELLGHSGTAMLHKHYSHLGTKAATLRDALGRVRG